MKPRTLRTDHSLASNGHRALCNYVAHRLDMSALYRVEGTISPAAREVTRVVKMGAFL